MGQKLGQISVVVMLLLNLMVLPAVAALQNFSHSDLKNHNFAGAQLAGGVFLAAEMRDADFSNANLTNAILTKGVLLRANLHGVAWC
jgi:uncharacterized protein YjbI with pentapeptide repeats